MSQQTSNHSFDELTRGLASGSISRGKALRLMGAALVGGTLGSLGIGEAAADDKCKPLNKKCRKDHQCCSRNCVNDACAPCPSGQTSCGTQCCQTGFTCVNGTCCPEARVCGAGTSVTCCTAGQDCVSDVCCTPLGSPCTDPAQCCGLSVCDANGTCCASGNQRCMADSECCGDFTCQEGQCLPVCLPNDAICSPNSPPPCCSGNCDTTSGTCACLPPGSPCTDPAQCCSDNCLDEVCCSGLGDSCDTDEDCCTHICDVNGQCNNCRSGGGTCTADEQCCDGFCNSDTCASCRSFGGSCTNGSECCSGLCENEICCNQQEAACNTANDCCGDLICDSNTCVPPPP